MERAYALMDGAVKNVYQRYMLAMYHAMDVLTTVKVALMSAQDV